MANINSLPRSLDVVVTLTRPQTELATDMTMLCFLANGGTQTGVNYYSSMPAVAAAYTPETSAYKAAAAFFARSDRPARMAVGIIDAGETPVEAAIRIQAKSKAQGHPIYSWALDAALRDTNAAKDFADWAESQTAYFSACTNDANAYNAANTDNFALYEVIAKPLMIFVGLLCQRVIAIKKPCEYAIR